MDKDTEIKILKLQLKISELEKDVMRLENENKDLKKSTSIPPSFPPYKPYEPYDRLIYPWTVEPSVTYKITNVC